MELTSPNHFSTTDKQIAFALVTAGCRFAPQSDGGPCQMTYTPDGLRNRRHLGLNPVTPAAFEEAAAAAYEKGVLGDVAYLIVRDYVFEVAIKAWDAMVDEFTAADKEGRAPRVPDITTEDTMRVLYMRRVTEQACKDIAFLNRPMLKIETGRTVTEEALPSVDGLPSPGTNVRTSMKAKVWTMGASKKLRDHLFSR